MQEELAAVRAKDDFDVARPLPRKNIDTGLGLERVAYLLQGVDNLYEIDQVYPVIEHAGQLSGKRYGADHTDDVRMRVVADHIRSGLMLIGDGVTPGNEARGYVLRRLLRRVVRSMRLLGVAEPVLPELLPVSRDLMNESYPEVETDWARISQIAYAEEEAFRRTLTTGTQIFDVAVADAKAEQPNRADRRPGVPAARHVRFSDRPDAGDGLRAGSQRRRRPLPDLDAGAEGPGQSRRQVQEGRVPGQRGLQGSALRRPDAVHGLSRAVDRVQGPRHRRRRRRSSRRPSRGPRSRSCWSRPRSTPSPAGRTPTPARSPATAWCSRSSTCSARSRA